MSEIVASRKGRRRQRKTLVLVGLLVGAVGLLSSPALAANAPIRISFEKHAVDADNYEGTTSDGGSIHMLVSNRSVTGNMQHFDVTIWTTVDGQPITAELTGTFNFSTAQTLLNGVVVDGWLEGARIHEQGNLVSLDPITFTGVISIMPAS
jgi:hypothetical protein